MREKKKVKVKVAEPYLTAGPSPQEMGFGNQKRSRLPNPIQLLAPPPRNGFRQPKKVNVAEPKRR